MITKHTVTIEIDREDDGRYIAELPDLPGVMMYGATQAEALRKVAVLGAQVLSERPAR